MNFDFLAADRLPPLGGAAMRLMARLAGRLAVLLLLVEDGPTASSHLAIPQAHRTLGHAQLLLGG